MESTLKVCAREGECPGSTERGGRGGSAPPAPGPNFALWVSPIRRFLSCMLYNKTGNTALAACSVHHSSKLLNLKGGGGNLQICSQVRQSAGHLVPEAGQAWLGSSPFSLRGPCQLWVVRVRAEVQAPQLVSEHKGYQGSLK